MSMWQLWTPFVQGCPNGEMVEVVGVEPTPATIKVADCKGLCESGQAPSSSIASPNAGKLCPELEKIVAAWANLRPELRAAILAIVSTSKGGTP